MDGEDRAVEGLHHLQAAAREAIAAARAFLDVAEVLVADPAVVSTVADAVGSVVRAAAQRGRSAVDDDHEGGRVEHIEVT